MLFTCTSRDERRKPLLSFSRLRHVLNRGNVFLFLAVFMLPFPSLSLLLLFRVVVEDVGRLFTLRREGAAGIVLFGVQLRREESRSHSRRVHALVASRHGAFSREAGLSPLKFSRHVVSRGERRPGLCGCAAPHAAVHGLQGWTARQGRRRER